MNGTATIKARPDQAVISLGVQTQANTAQSALADNASKMTALIAALTNKGIAKDDIATSYVSIYPTYGNNGMDITGYQAVNQSMSRFATSPRLAGSSTTPSRRREPVERHHVQLSDQNQGVDEALADAVANARSKAETLAGAGNAQLGEVSVDPGGLGLYAADLLRPRHSREFGRRGVAYSDPASDARDPGFGDRHMGAHVGRRRSVSPYRFVMGRRRSRRTPSA